MPALDFHVNVEPGVAYLCRLVRKIRAAGRTIVIYSRQPERIARLDQALWTFSVLDFLPHVVVPSRLAARTPVWLADSPTTAPRDVLLLQDDTVPEGFSAWFEGFDRVIDIVSSEPAERDLGRQRFKAYRDAGMTPVVHDLAASQ